MFLEVPVIGVFQNHGCLSLGRIDMEVQQFDDVGVAQLLVDGQLVGNASVVDLGYAESLQILSRQAPWSRRSWRV